MPHRVSSGRIVQGTVGVCFLALSIAGCAGRRVVTVQPQRASAWVIRNVQVVDPDSGVVHAGMAVRVEGGRIVAVEPDGPPPHGVQVLDGEGRYLVPGLMDMHVHFAADEPADRVPEKLVAWGVTSVRDMGGYPERLAAIRADIDARRRTGPRVYAAGMTLNGEAAAGFHRVVRTPEEVRAAVRDMKTWGADFIKVHRALPPDLLNIVVAEARSAGLRVVGHVSMGVGVAQASIAGMASIEHVEAVLEAEMMRQDDPAPGMAAGLERLTGDVSAALWRDVASHKTAFTPTLSAYAQFVSEAEPDRREMGMRLYQSLADMVPAAHSAGVVILAGTDFRNGRAGVSLHEELAALVAAGLTPAQALRAATSDAGRFLGIPSGRIEPGMSADLVLVDGDPIQDITNLRRIRAVVLRGRVLDRAEIDPFRGTP